MKYTGLLGIQRLLGVVGIVVSLVLAQAAIASASSVTIFSGADAGAIAPGPFSTAAAASFDSAAALIGPGAIITFESPLIPTNSPISQTIALNTGVSVTGSSIDIQNVLICGADLCGNNTTAGGSQWLDVFGGSATFDFAQPIQFFGAYFGGLQGSIVGQETITFNDGSAQTVNIPVLDGGFAFVGFTDAGASINSVTVSMLGDIVSVDDVRYGPTSHTIPEPSSIALLAGALVSMAGALWRKAKS